MTEPIIVVSGLPRSGTSLMMQMLDSGGVEVVTDHVRAADVDNPRGYYELERAKAIARDSSWLPQARGKAFKVVSQLLYHLPGTERYRVLFMERDLDEMLLSQEKMLRRSGRTPPPPDQMKRDFTLHLERLHGWLSRQPHMEVLRVGYNDLVERPEAQAERVRRFLGRGDPARMTAAVDPALYRNRKAPGSPGSDPQS